MDLLTTAATIGLVIAGASHVASIGLAMRRTVKGRRRLGTRPPAGVSILRPVCGLEHCIEDTLAASFRIDHPRYEVLFCVAAADDPVVPLVQRLIREHPAIPARLLVGGGGRGPNPKLDNLMKAWDVAAHDWVVLADSNVLIPPDYLDQLFARWSERCAVVCSPPVGIDLQGWAAELEAAFLNTFEARWQLAGDEVGCGFAQGKTMLLRRSDLAQDGGLAALAREVAEDAAATKFARRLGRKVRVVDQPFPQPLGRRNFAGVWRRQLRWARLRRLSFPAFFCAELPVGGVFPCLLATWLATAGVLPWAGVVGMMLAWYGAEALLARAFGWPLRLRSPLLWIARDLLLPVLWVRAWTLKVYEWRGSAVDVRPTAPTPDPPALGPAPSPLAARSGARADLMQAPPRVADEVDSSRPIADRISFPLILTFSSHMVRSVKQKCAIVEVLPCQPRFCRCRTSQRLHSRWRSSCGLEIRDIVSWPTYTPRGDSQPGESSLMRPDSVIRGSWLRPFARRARKARYEGGRTGRPR